MKAKTAQPSRETSKQIVERLVKEWHASKARKAAPRVSVKTTATGRGLVKFHGVKVLEKYGSSVASRVAAKRKAVSNG